MCLVKKFRIGQKCVEAGFCAEENFPPAILRTRKVFWVSTKKDSPAQGGEFARDRFFGGN
jgi:hypothetical protein